VLPARLPATAEVFGAGRAGLRHVEVIARVLGSKAAGRLSPEQWAGAEEQLATMATLYTPTELHNWGKALVELLDQDGQAPDDRPPIQVNDIVTALAFSPDGRRLAVGTSEDWKHAPQVYLVDPETGEFDGDPLPHVEKGLRQVAFNPDGSRLFAASELHALFGDCDALIAPAAVGEAPLADTGTGDPVMSRMWTALHVPCLAVPVATGPQGLPVGIQLIAPLGADESLLRVGEWTREALTKR